MALLPVLLDMVDEIYDNLDSPANGSFAEVPLLFLPQRATPGGGCPRMSRRGCQRGGEAKECPIKDCPARACQKAESKEHEATAAAEHCPSGRCPKSGKCHRKEGPKDGERQKEWNTLAIYEHPWARQFLPPFDMTKHCHQQQLGHRRCPAAAKDDFQLALDVKAYKPEEISVKVKGREILIEGKHEEREDEHGFVSRQFSRRYTLPEHFDIDSVSSHLSSSGKMIIKAIKPKPVVVSELNERIIPIERVARTPSPPPQAAVAAAVAEADKKSEAPATPADANETGSPAATFEIINDTKEQ